MLQFLGTAVAITAFFAILGEGIKSMLPRILPLDVLDEGAAPEVSESVAGTLAMIEWVASLAAMVLFPVTAYNLLARLLDWLAPAQSVVVWYGGPALAFGYVLAGIFFGPWIVQRFIGMRYRGREGNALAEWYRRSEDRRGSAGRLVMTHSASIALCLIVLTTVYAANRYTLVDAQRIELADGIVGRRSIPMSSVRRVIDVKHGGRHTRVELATGEALTTTEAIGHTGELSGRGQEEAIELIVKSSGLDRVHE